MALRYLTTFSALLTIILAKDTNDPSPLKDANLLLTPALLPGRPPLGQRNSPLDLLLSGISGRLLRHVNPRKRVCGGSALHSTCPNDVTKCCPVGGDHCGDGVCEYGYLCQRNHLDEAVCCPRGHDCSVLLPINPCAIATHTKCAGFDACCPLNKTCQLVGSGISCVDLPGGGSGNALAKRAESSSAIIVSGGSGSGPTVSPTPVVSVQISVSVSVSVSKPQPPSSVSSVQPVSASTSVQPVSSSNPSVRPPTSSTPVQPVSSSNPLPRPPTSSKPPPSVTNRPPSTTQISPVTSRPPSTIAKPNTVTTTGPGRTLTLASTTVRDGSTIVTQVPTVVVAGGSGAGTKSASPVTTVETSMSASAVVTDGVTSYVDVPVVTTRVVTPDLAGTETQTSQPNNAGGSNSKSGPNPAVIAGASVGGTVILAAILLAIFLVRKNAQKKKRKKDSDMQGIFKPPPVREPTIPVLPPPPPSSVAGGRGSTASPVSELSSRGIVAPVARYSSMTIPPGVAELQEEAAAAAAAAREGNATSDYYPANIPYELHHDEQMQQMQQVYNGYPVHAQPGLHEVYGNPQPGSPPPPQQQYGHPQQQQYTAYPGGNGGEYPHGGY